jgi:hypothetical protein
MPLDALSSSLRDMTSLDSLRSDSSHDVPVSVKDSCELLHRVTGLKSLKLLFVRPCEAGSKMARRAKQVGKMTVLNISQIHFH